MNFDIQSEWKTREPEPGEITMPAKKSTLVFRDCIMAAFQRYLEAIGMPKEEIVAEIKVFNRYLAAEIAKNKFEEK